MPTKIMEKWAKDSGKSLSTVEAAWNSCKIQAKKTIKKEGPDFYRYVTTCTKAKLGLAKPTKEDLVDVFAIENIKDEITIISNWEKPQDVRNSTKSKTD